MEAIKKKKISSGNQHLDSLLGDLYVGDNVLWYEESGNFSSIFCQDLIRDSLARFKPTIYVSFDRAPQEIIEFLGPLAENQYFTLIDCFSTGKGETGELFCRFYSKDNARWPYQVITVDDPASPVQVCDAINGVLRNLAGDIRMIMDSVSGMLALWGGNDQVLKFYLRASSQLYDLDTFAFWIMGRQATDQELKAAINKQAQAAVEFSAKGGKTSFKVLKARNARFLNEPQAFTFEDNEIVFDQPRPLPGRFNLGSRIKAIRKTQGLSQKELAEKTGVTPSSISQIEKNLIFPSIPALFRLAESLNVEVSSFFEGMTPVQQGCVFHGSDGEVASLAKSTKNIVEGQHLLPPDSQDASVEPYLLRFEAGRKLSGHFFSHKGEEVGYLLSGTLTMQVNGQRQEAVRGDIIYLRNDTPEQWENTGGEPAEILWIKIR